MTDNRWREADFALPLGGVESRCDYLRVANDPLGRPRAFDEVLRGKPLEDEFSGFNGGRHDVVATVMRKPFVQAPTVV